MQGVMLSIAARSGSACSRRGSGEVDPVRGNGGIGDGGNSCRNDDTRQKRDVLGLPVVHHCPGAFNRSYS